MTELVVFDKQVCENYGEKDKANASEKLADSSRQGGDVKCPGDKLTAFNITQDRSDDGTNTRYPNGVRIDRDSTAVGMTPPPGGSLGEDKFHNTTLLDSKGHVVAKLDSADKTVHVYTKHGEFIESKDGTITFKSKENITDLQSLHKEGVVDKSKYEDYGVSTNGNIIRFPNGVEWDVKGNHPVLNTGDHPNFNQQKSDDGSKNTGYDGNKVIYTWDKTGLRVPTADGVLTRTPDGHIKFESNNPTAKALPKVELHGDHKQAKAKPKIVIPEECLKDNADPLCGLDLTGF